MRSILYHRILKRHHSLEEHYNAPLFFLAVQNLSAQTCTVLHIITERTASRERWIGSSIGRASPFHLPSCCHLAYNRDHQNYREQDIAARLDDFLLAEIE